MKKETYMKILDSAVLRLEEKQSLCALVGTISRNAGCPLTIKENLKGVK